MDLKVESRFAADYKTIGHDDYKSLGHAGREQSKQYIKFLLQNFKEKIV